MRFSEFTIGVLRRASSGRKITRSQTASLAMDGLIEAADDGRLTVTTQGAEALKNHGKEPQG